MFDLFNELIGLIRQYTIADTASVFAIIEGLATVVAAVGAIIAVIITRRIASRQIGIAIEQNKISSKQAEIAAQQNKIALLEKRANIYDKLLALKNHWYCFSENFIEGLKKIPSINSFQAYISLRELETLDTNYFKDKNLYELRSIHSKFVIQDAYSFSQTLRLFYIPNDAKAKLANVMEIYKKFSTEVHSLNYPDYSTNLLEEVGRALNDELNSQSWREVLDYLENQISFNRLEDQA